MPIPAAPPPQIDSSLFKLPDNYAKSARETKAQFFQNQLSTILGQGTDYANYLTGEETRRYNESNAVLGEGRKAFDKPSMTDQDVARMFSGAADRAAYDFNANLSGLRAKMGATGRTGGGFDAGMGARYRAMRSASLTDATRSLYEKRIDADMQDRRERWAADQALAAGIGRDPSIVGLDWLGQAGTATLGAMGIEQQRSAAKDAANASKQGAKMSGVGQIAGAGIGLLA